MSSPEGLFYPLHAESHVRFVNTGNPLQVNAILRGVPDVETLTVVFRPLPQTTRSWEEGADHCRMPRARVRTRGGARGPCVAARVTKSAVSVLSNRVCATLVDNGLAGVVDGSDGR